MLYWFSIAVIKTVTKSNLWRKEFISPILFTSQSFMEESQDRNSKQETGGRG